MGLPPQVDCRCLAPGLRRPTVPAGREHRHRPTEVVPQPTGRYGQLQVPGTGVAAKFKRQTTGARHRFQRAGSRGQLRVPGTDVLTEVSGGACASCGAWHRGSRPGARLAAQSGHASRAQAAASGAGARTACGDAARASARAHRERCPDRRLRGVREARLRRRRGDRHAARPRLRRRRCRPPRGRRPADSARVRGARAGSSAARAARDPRRMRPPGLPARRGRGRAAPPVRRAGRRGRRLLDRRVAARRAHRGHPRGARRPAVGAAAAVRARVGDHHRTPGPDGAALRLQRPEHDRRVHPHGSRPRQTARAGLRRPSAAAGSPGRASSSPSTTSSATSAATCRSKRRASARSSR